MSLRDPAPTPRSADVPVANDFQQRFIRDAHTLLAEGFVRLIPETLATKNEEAISGAIVDRINEWFDGPTTPAWTRSYFVKPEIRAKSGKREGKDCPRIDIYVESSEARPRAQFAFEAKRFYRGDSVAKYVGAAGLGAFLDGTYTPDAPAAGMLGFVQQGSNDGHVEKVREKLEAERDSHGLAGHGAVWIPISLDTRIGATWVSRHERAAPRAAIEIYHSFLRCTVSSRPAAAAPGSTSQLDLLSWRPTRRP